MRLLCFLGAGFLAALLGAGPARAEDPLPSPRTLELVEDLRILSILNVLEPTRDQSRKLAAVAVSGKEGLAAIDAEVQAKLDQQRARLMAGRAKAVRGGSTSPTTDSLFAEACQVAEAARARKTEMLILGLIARVRGILNPDQAARIENELAPSIDQPWRRYARMLTGPNRGGNGGGRMPADPGHWLRELRDLRVDSAEGDPKVEIADFGKKLTRGLPPGPLTEETASQARAFAVQVLAMPQNVFNQKELELARLTARQELDTRNRQNRLDGKPLEVFDSFRWLVEQVLLSPRASVDLRDRAARP